MPIHAHLLHKYSGNRARMLEKQDEKDTDILRSIQPSVGPRRGSKFVCGGELTSFSINCFCLSAYSNFYPQLSVLKNFKLTEKLRA